VEFLGGKFTELIADRGWSDEEVAAMLINFVLIHPGVGPDALAYMQEQAAIEELLEEPVPVAVYVCPRDNGVLYATYVRSTIYPVETYTGLVIQGQEAIIRANWTLHCGSCGAHLTTPFGGPAGDEQLLRYPVPEDIDIEQ
jgi:hypothetical protein